MRLFPLVAVLFLAVPILEIYFLIKIGGVIGVLPTVALVVLTAVLGAALLRAEGLATLARVRSTIDRGELPAFEMLEGICLLVGGALLLTPGFVTDGFGFLCLLPPSRRLLVKGFMARIKLAPVTHPAQDGTAGPREGHTIEGEFTEKNDHR